MRKTALILALALTVAACTGAAPGPQGSTSTTSGTIPKLDNPSLAALVALSTVDSCDELLDHFKNEALDRVGPWGLDGYGGYYPWAGRVLEDAIAAGEAPQASSDAGYVAGVDYSGTNVQELGVDEADIVKTDGDRIFAIIQNEQLYYLDGYYGGYGSGAVLVAIDITDTGPELAGTLNLGRGWGHEMFLAGDRVFVISNGSRPGVTISAAPNIWEGDYIVPQVGVTLISEIDVSDLDDMTVVRDLYFDGTYVTSRLADGSARVVVRTQPTGLEFTHPQGSGLRAERDATERNRQVIRDSTIDNWLPYYVLEDHSGPQTEVTEGRLFGCGDVYLPEESAGLGLTAILTFRTSDGLALSPASAAIFAQGETVYATAENLYVATNPWVDPVLLESNWRTAADNLVTTVHRFELTPESVSYTGSGAVTGYLLNQFSLSEHEGYLRVATTDAASRWGFSSDQQSFVSILETGSMDLVGKVGELGRGEQIYSVRFIGDTGFVVTFRQVDPLYAVDLSRPDAPTVVGELKIPGYSAYLHPVGEDRLLGVGQDATEDGRILGSQVSLFDVSDPTQPRLLSKLVLDGDGGNSEVEYDHRAFLYWAAEELAVLPLQSWNWDGRSESYFNGAIGVHIHNSEVHLLDKITHQGDAAYWEYGAQIRRSLVIGDELYTISNMGMKASDVETLEDRGWLSFGS